MSKQSLGAIMKKIIAFWKKDLLGKAILLLSGAIILGFAVNIYLFISLTPEGLYQAIVPPTPRRLPTSFFTPPPSVHMPVAPTDWPTLPTISPATRGPVFPSPTQNIQPLPTETIILPITSPTATLTQVSNITVPSACIPTDQSPEKGTALEALDGYTIRVLAESDGLVYVVRYAGVEAPPYENDTNLWGRVAFQKNSKLIFGKAILMFKDGPHKDASGRLLRYVLAGDLFVNHELIRLGLATALKTSPPLACESFFQSAETQARTTGMGRWAGTPTAKP
jgi:endonuclease YncB( thermonuclease family)